MRKLILRTDFSLGDVVMLTAAVRDLHRQYAGQFQTDVRTHFPEVWENNPYITCLNEREPGVEVLQCRYPLINYANYRPYHCLHGYISFLNEQLDLDIVPTEFRGDIHLSREEKEWASQVHELTDQAIPFWIIAAGGKHDIPIKWWDSGRYQEVVDRFRGRIAFVQIGEWGHHHPKLRNTIDLRGQTSIRELVRLVYHAQGCLCSVTALMHLAAAIETRRGRPPNRPCVVVAGGREPPHWEAYPHHQYLHRVGALRCCHQGGCWKSRALPLGDGTSADKAPNLCVDVVDGLSHCMGMITPEEVIRAIEGYFEGGAVRYLTRAQARAAERGIARSQENSYDLHSLNPYDAPSLLERTIDNLPAFPGGFDGRGIVICGGGLRYFPCAWVCINMLRHTGCRLPIEFWFQGKEEMDRRMIRLIEALGVRCVDACEMEKAFPRRIRGGWELKSYALLHTRFAQALLLDADNVPVRDPSFLFDHPGFLKTGAVFWPDYGCLSPEREIWSICRVPYRKEPEFETGQILVDKERSWRALNLAFWFNDHSDFFYKYIHGDKETFHLAWRKLDQAYTMVPTPIRSLDGIMCQHDLEGKRLFQHRNTHKWRAFDANKRVPGFAMEARCLEYLRRLERQWDGNIHVELDKAVHRDGFVFRGGTYDQAVFHEVFEKNEYQLPERLPAKAVVLDIGAHIGSFSYACLKRGAGRVLGFEPDPENFRLAAYNLNEFKRRVRVYPQAVWRSDRHPGLLPHSGYPQHDSTINTGGGTVLLGAEGSPQHRKKELVPTISLDAILARFKSVHLLKLDCEGSEWPILFTSKQLHKVERLCGEYHELDPAPTMARVGSYRRYGKKELEEFLALRYKTIRIRAHTAPGLGLFWAENPR